MRKIVSLLSVLMLFCALAFGQTRTITGHVRDDKGEAIPFATITEAGTRNAVRADANGSFSIKVNQGAKLVISAVGFEASNVTPGGTGDENFVLATTAGMIQENVIITAQGLKRRPKELGYSAAQVTTSDLTVGQSPRVGQALSGKVSGLTIFNIDASVDPQVKVVLRGYRSLTGNNDALVVIDGIPYANQTSLASLNPNDIESISVLKGGQAATLYGSAGVNGVLLVTTKRGTRSKLKVNYSNTTNFEKLAWLPDFQDQYGSGSHYAAGFGTAGYKTNYLDRMHDNWRPFENQQYGDAYNGEQRIIGRVTEDGDKFILPYSPIEGERQRAWNTGFTTNNQIGFSGGDQTSTYYLSAENNYTEGIVYGDKSRRTGVRIAATKEVGKLRVGFNAAYVQAGYDRTTSDFYFDAINQAAHIPLSQLRDWRNNKFANPNGYYNDYYNNPYFNADNNRQKYADANLSGSFEINYKLLPWLNVYDRVGVINNSRTRKNYTSKFIYSDWAKNDAYVPAPWDYANDYDGIDRAGTNILGSVLDRITNDNTLNNEFQIHLDKDFGQFSNKLVLGASIFQQRQKQIEVNSGSLVQDSLYNVGNRQGELGGGEFNTTYRKYGYYADLTTGWKDFLFLHGSFRLDASSLFYTPTRDKSLYQYPYYGVDASFILTEALPGVKSSFLNYAKIRAGFNRNGNDPL
ncbi:MAG TPA: TonB-dependent receptor plug domain-containing protein, partial [Flavisolibacter sp.]|nr:TonB-dependent receptor plug domain-containing protein [Flavisolibacter sp.]